MRIAASFAPPCVGPFNAQIAATTALYMSARVPATTRAANVDAFSSCSAWRIIAISNARVSASVGAPPRTHSPAPHRATRPPAAGTQPPRTSRGPRDPRCRTRGTRGLPARHRWSSVPSRQRRRPKAELTSSPALREALYPVVRVLRVAHRVTLIPGDGTGPELTEATRRVLEATGVDFEWDVRHAGEEVMARYGGNPLPDEVLDAIRESRVALKGPITTPVGGGFRSVNVGLRKALDLYAQVRPCKSYAGVRSRFDEVDLLVVRENTEDLYAGIEYEQGTNEANELIEWI